MSRVSHLLTRRGHVQGLCWCENPFSHLDSRESFREIRVAPPIHHHYDTTARRSARVRMLIRSATGIM
jgi:hypothetical protein